MELRNSCFDQFKYISSLDVREKQTFAVVLQKLILNMDVRFPCPSAGLDTKRAEPHIDFTNNTLNKQLLRETRLNCPLLEIVDIFLFPDELIREVKMNEFFVSGRYPEVQRMAREIVINQELRALLSNRRQSNDEAEEGRENTITLMDIFVFVDRNTYPTLWKTVLKTLALIPTSVSCEQYFSRLRNKSHENMSKARSPKPI